MKCPMNCVSNNTIENKHKTHPNNIMLLSTRIDVLINLKTAKKKKNNKLLILKVKVQTSILCICN